MVKNPSASAGDIGDLVQSLGREDLLEQEMQPTPVFLPGESHGEILPCGLQSVGSQRVRHD